MERVENASGEKDEQRWFAILDYLEECGGRVQRKQVDFCRDVGMPQRALARRLERMERLGVIRVERPAGAFAEGRQPNIYTQKVTSDEWRARSKQIIEADRQRRKRERRREKRERGQPIEEYVPPAAASDRDVIEREVEQRIVGVDQAETFDPDAWLAGDEVEA